MTTWTKRRAPDSDDAAFYELYCGQEPGWQFNSIKKGPKTSGPFFGPFFGCTFYPGHFLDINYMRTNFGQDIYKDKLWKYLGQNLDLVKNWTKA